MQVVIGVDGGGTKTTCIAMDTADRKILGRGEGGSSNKNSVGADAAQSAVQRSIFAALGQAGTTIQQVVAVCLTMSGCDRPEDEETIRAWMTPIFAAQNIPIYIYNDAYGALASGTDGNVTGSAVAISGTGTIVFGVGLDGKSCRVSGWGPLFEDIGSGMCLGSAALNAIAAAHDGRGSQTSLTEAVLSHLKLKHPTDLIKWAYGASGWAHIAALAPVVLECAVKGDRVARIFVEESADQLAKNVQIISTKVQLGVCSGEESKVVSERQAIRKKASKADIWAMIGLAPAPPSVEYVPDLFHAIGIAPDPQIAPQWGGDWWHTVGFAPDPKILSDCIGPRAEGASGATKPFKLVFAGGLLQQGGVLATAFESRVKTMFPQIQICYPSLEPATGAALLAMNPPGKQ